MSSVFDVMDKRLLHQMSFVDFDLNSTTILGQFLNESTLGQKDV